LNLVYTKKYTEIKNNIFQDGKLVGTETYCVPYLEKYTDAVERETIYGYENETLDFSFFEKNTANHSTTGFIMLTSIYYPTSLTSYSYEKIKRNLGPDGTTE